MQPGGRFGGEQRGFVMRDPVTTAIDTNSDGVIDAGEIAGAPAALKKLDRNGDGKLTQDELRPAMPMGARGGPGQPQGNAQQTVSVLMQYDKNGDGKLAKDELPERMQSLMERGDADKDGFLSREELSKLSSTQGGTAAPMPNRGRGERREDD